jgi:prepilin-type N-terminal cleavage/methylation domain-containing protein
MLQALTRKDRRQRRGFTLTELVIVVAVIGVLLAIGMPALWEIIQEIKLKNAGRELVSAMRSARYKAISEVRDYGVMARYPNEVEIFQGNDPATGVLTREFLLPTAIGFQGPGEFESGGTEAIDGNDGEATNPGFEENDDGGWVIFRADGSANAAGAFRLGNINLHNLEVRVGPATTARIRILKYDQEEAEWEEGG